MQSLSPKDWINVDELTLERSKNNLIYSKKKDDITRYQNPSNNQWNFNRIKKDLLSSIIKVINNKKKKNSSRVDG